MSSTEDGISIEFMKFIFSIPTFPLFVFLNFYRPSLLFAHRPSFLLWLSEEAELFTSKRSFSFLDKPQNSEKKEQNRREQIQVFFPSYYFYCKKKGVTTKVGLSPTKHNYFLIWKSFLVFFCLLSIMLQKFKIKCFPTPSSLNNLWWTFKAPFFELSKTI